MNLRISLRGHSAWEDVILPFWFRKFWDFRNIPRFRSPGSKLPKSHCLVDRQWWIWRNFVNLHESGPSKGSFLGMEMGPQKFQGNRSVGDIFFTIWPRWSWGLTLCSLRCWFSASSGLTSSCWWWCLEAQDRVLSNVLSSVEGKHNSL